MIHLVDCQSKGCKPSNWGAEVEILSKRNPFEAYVSARGSCFHLIVGHQRYGYYLCIPDWSIGSELSQLNDCFWNVERLRNYCHMKKTDAETIAQVLAHFESMIEPTLFEPL